MAIAVRLSADCEINGDAMRVEFWKMLTRKVLSTADQFDACVDR